MKKTVEIDFTSLAYRMSQGSGASSGLDSRSQIKTNLLKLDATASGFADLAKLSNPQTDLGCLDGSITTLQSISSALEVITPKLQTSLESLTERGRSLTAGLKAIKTESDACSTALALDVEHLHSQIEQLSEEKSDLQERLSGVEVSLNEGKTGLNKELEMISDKIVDLDQTLAQAASNAMHLETCNTELVIKLREAESENAALQNTNSAIKNAFFAKKANLDQGFQDLQTKIGGLKCSNHSEIANFQAWKQRGGVQSHCATMMYLCKVFGKVLDDSSTASDKSPAFIVGDDWKLATEFASFVKCFRARRNSVEIADLQKLLPHPTSKKEWQLWGNREGKSIHERLDRLKPLKDELASIPNTKGVFNEPPDDQACKLVERYMDCLNETFDVSGKSNPQGTNHLNQYTLAIGQKGLEVAEDILKIDQDFRALLVTKEILGDAFFDEAPA